MKKVKISKTIAWNMTRNINKKYTFEIKTGENFLHQNL